MTGSIGRTFIRFLPAALAVALLGAGGAAGGQSSAANPPTQPLTYLSLPVDMDVRPGALQFVPADDGDRRLAYNLFVTNWGNWPLRLARVDVEDAATGRVLVSYDAEALENPYRQRATPFSIGPTSPQNRDLEGRRTTIFNIELRLAANAAPPASIRHRVLFEPDPGVRLLQDDGTPARELVSVSVPVAIDGPAPVVLGAPLRGGPWLCGNGLGLRSDHNYIGTASTARMRVSQRYGCDFLKIFSTTVREILPSPFPDTLTPGMFYGYGAEVLAVADARVAEVRDGIPESTPQADGSVRMPLTRTEDTGPGNRVVLDLGGGRFAFYAHLQPGSIRVRRGDRVREGQVLGRIGMSGNAVNPHLHFHVGNGPDLNGSDGVPYVFRSYLLSGRGNDDFADRQVSHVVPLQSSVMTFPGAASQSRR
ncbi:MAG TPA: M23 family metallopeptidase [Allosphingosinicella sp.]|nr:M23 family metallopeptidase [Allosphingosinicella sp.]